MSLAIRLEELATGLAADLDALKAADGDLSALETSAKTSLVAAINEIHGALMSAGAHINDASANDATDVAWSPAKINAVLTAATTALKNDILGGAGDAYNTLKELQDLITADEGVATGLSAALANRVRFDEAQVLTAEQKATALSNIGAVSVDAIGDTEQDLLAIYQAAKQSA